MTNQTNAIDSELYATIFPEKAQAYREALAIGAQLVEKIKSFNATLSTDIWGDPVAQPAKPAVSYIGVITKFGRFYNVRVLASTGRSTIAVCTREDEAEAIAYTEQKYAGVEWVLENRFAQEVACL